MLAATAIRVFVSRRNCDKAGGKWRKHLIFNGVHSGDFVLLKLRSAT
jgi:hypothetical protein